MATVTNAAAVEKKITKARTRLLLNHPFFGTLGLKLKLVAVEDEKLVNTMATDGTHLFYHPPFVAQLPDDELQGVIAHEVLHPALGHHARRGDRDPKGWNIACDLAINPMIVDAGLKLPKEALLDRQFANMSAEQIYARIPKMPSGASGSGSQQSGSQQQSGSSASQKSGRGKAQQQSQKQQGSNGSANGAQSSPTPGQDVPQTDGGFGQVIDAVEVDPNTGQLKQASPAEAQRQADEWKISAEQARRTAKRAGNMPGNIERAVDANKDEKVDWRETLRRFITSSVPTDYSWTMPNRRYIGANVYLPSMIKEGIGEIVVAVDTSGSIGTEELAQFSAELNAISHEARPEKIHVVYCDARVNHTDEFSADEDIELKGYGGGGTDFRPPFAWVEEQGIEPRCLIYLTDLCCTSYPAEPAYPVLWVCDRDQNYYKAPWGETVIMEVL